MRNRLKNEWTNKFVLYYIKKKLNLTNRKNHFCFQKIDRYIHEHFSVALHSQTLIWKWCFFHCSVLGWREETVEIEREGVELFISAISFECSELSPPWHSPIFRTILVLKSVVQKHSNNQCNRWGRKEYSIKEIIELQNQRTIIVL